MPNISEMLLKLEGFKHDISLHLNKVCYYIQISQETSNLFMIII